MESLDNFSKTNWKYLAIVAVLGLSVGGGLLLFVFSSRYSEIPSLALDIPQAEYANEVKASTDKKSYSAEENVTIAIENNLDKSIWISTT